MQLSSCDWLGAGLVEALRLSCRSADGSVRLHLNAVHRYSVNTLSRLSSTNSRAKTALLPNPQKSKSGRAARVCLRLPSSALKLQCHQRDLFFDKTLTTPKHEEYRVEGIVSHPCTIQFNPSNCTK